MVSLIVASYCMILAPQPDVEDNPRLQKPISIVSGTISARQVLERVSKATGVKLAWKCDFNDPLMALSIQGEAAGDVLRMVSDCLNLAWRPSGSGYELYMPASTAKREKQYKSQHRQTVASLLAKKAIDWRTPANQVGAAIVEVGYTRQAFSCDEMNQLLNVLTKANQERLLHGETLVFSTNSAPGTERMSPAFQRIPKPDAEYMAIRLEPMSGKLRACQWSTIGGKLSSFDAAVYPLDKGLSESYPERELIRRSGYVDPWQTDIDDDSIDLYIQKLSEKEQRNIESVSPGFGDIDAWFRMFAQYHFGPVVVVRPPLARYESRLSEAKFTLGIPFSQYWNPGIGYFRRYDNATYWRPVNYWYRNELAQTQKVGNLAAYKDARFLTLMDNIAGVGLGSRYWSVGNFGLDISTAGTPPERLPSMCQLWKSMSTAQKKASIETVVANASYSRERPALKAKALLLSTLRKDQRALAQMALKEMLAEPWYFYNRKQPNVAKLLDPINAPKLYFKVQGARLVTMDFADIYGCYHIGEGIFPPSKWRSPYRTSKRRSLFGIGYWMIWLTFGIKDGPEISSRFIQHSPFVRIPADVVSQQPNKAYQQFLKAMNKPVY